MRANVGAYAPENIGAVRILDVQDQHGMAPAGLVIQSGRCSDPFVPGKAKSLAELLVR